MVNDDQLFRFGLTTGLILFIDFLQLMTSPEILDLEPASPSEPEDLSLAGTRFFPEHFPA
jgi:hypothetical protein